MAEKPRIVVSGINRGVNLGDDITYSGTVSAAFEGTLMSVPSFAISQQVVDDTANFDEAARFARDLAEQYLRDLEQATEVTLPEVRRASLPRRLGRSTARLLSPLL